MRKKITISLILIIILIVAVGLSLFYGLNIQVRVLLVCMLADYLIGIAMAISGNSKHGALKSHVGYTGLVKKSVMIFIVVIMGLLEKLLNIDFLQKTITIAFIFNELVSIVENASLLGLPVANILPMLKNRQMKGDDNKNDANK